MTRTRAKAPITSFGPEILSALIAGSKTEVRIPLPYRDAVRMRQRLYQLRRRMLEENHEAYLAVSRCFITIIWGREAGFETEAEIVTSKNIRFPKDRSAPTLVIIRPQDAEFASAITKAGVKTQDLTVEPLSPTPGEDVLEGYLNPEPETPNG